MARTFKEEEFTARRNEILAVVRRLVYTRGFDQMSIQDILDEVHISKGAFYHYFESKQSLLEGLTDHMLDEVEQVLLPIVNHPEWNALQKFQRYFDSAAMWKVAQKDFILALMNVWFADENAVVRTRVTSASLKRLAPLLNAIVRQGNAEGSMSCPTPDAAGGIVFSLVLGLNDTIADLFLPRPPRRAEVLRVAAIFRAYNDAVERVLGAPSGSLHLLDEKTLLEWAEDDPPAEPSVEKK